MRERESSSVAEERKPAKPFLKWAGGKQKILKELLNRLPKDVRERTYREPFLGAGSVFFAVRPAKAFLSDANEHLIKCYEYVRDDPDLVQRYLRAHASGNSEEYYYRVRKEYNANGFSAAQAARFIYLNKACFNGIFRVNQKGCFNVPYGKYERPPIPGAMRLTEASEALRTAELSCSKYEDALEDVEKGDFVYLDPPYPPLNGTSYFSHYTIDKFSEEDQENLAAIVSGLDAAGCLFMASNAKTDKIVKLYRRFNKVTLPVTRFITCKSRRHTVKELVITNYEIVSP